MFPTVFIGSKSDHFLALSVSDWLLKVLKLNSRNLSLYNPSSSKTKVFHFRSLKKLTLVQQDRYKKLLLGFVAVAIWIGQSCDVDLFKLLYGFLTLCTPPPTQFEPNFLVTGEFDPKNFL